MNKTAILFILLTLLFKTSSGVFIDSCYLFSRPYTTDSSYIFLVVHSVVSSSPCSVDDFSLAHNNDTIGVTVCYEAGFIQSTCPRVDTFDLGIRQNNPIKVIAAFLQNSDGVCKSSSLFQDSFTLEIHPEYNNLKNLDASEINVTPNPVNSILKIQNSSALTSFQILSTSGRVLMQRSVTKQTNLEIDVSALAAGLYFLQLWDGKRQVVRKFVKQ